VAINEIVIVGGGKSIETALNLPSNLSLQIRLADKCTILTNYAYKTFPGTFLAFNDRDFYVPEYAKKYPDKNPDIYEELKKLPLIIGVDHNGISEFKLDNTILLNNKYRSVLTGIFALKLAMELMKSGTIYLLGFDWNRRIGLPERDPNYNPNSDLQIHFYNDIKHRGVGYVGYYENHNPDRDFNQFIKKDIKIYNVSPESNINSFEKISYEQFFKLLSNKGVNQEELRDKIKAKLLF
jgi:hypothetical protein